MLSCVCLWGLLEGLDCLFFHVVHQNSSGLPTVIFIYGLSMYTYSQEDALRAAIEMIYTHSEAEKKS